MASNYEGICEENRESYGTKGAQKSGRLAAGLYDDRTHFIFELLQNAEDALGRRSDRHGPRKVAFALTPTRLALSHFGKPFDEADVRSVCDIAESTKNESSIGRFGLGFKSVYTVTDLPEIHSGDEDFAIENYVFPKRLERSARAADETQIILPLKPGDASAAQDITAGFRHLGPGALLFLRHIDEINWSVDGGASGFYLRNTPETLGPNVQRITVIGKEDDRPEVDQNWLVFHRDVFSAERQKVGRVEIAFSLVAVKDAPGRWAVRPLAKSPLVVFFPTVVESHLGFLVQGPYRTTPSRDNIPPGEPWNQHLVKETSSLLVEAMRWMRDKALLDVSALRCLPLDREKFPQDSRFAPMFDAVRQAFQEEALLPTFDGRHVTAHQAKLARTQELRELFSPEQVTALFGSEVAAWLSGDITQDKAAEIRQYLMRELDIDEITPTKLVPIRTLNQIAWVPNAEGEFVPPGLVVFDTLGWKPNPFLLTKIAFKPPIIDQLAKEAGIDPAALDLLRKLGITNVADLTSRLGITNSPSEPELSTAPEPEADEPSDGDVYDDAKDLYGDDMPDIPPGTPDPDAGDSVGNGGGRGGQGHSGTGTARGGGQGNGGAHGGSGGHGAAGGKGSGNGGGQGKRTPGHVGGRPFISYVGAHPDDDGPDPDGLDQAERMQIEGHAIDLIIGLEPTLRRTPDGNPGFDLYEADSGGRQIRWVEVKSMTGSLEDRPVGLSHTQFDCAREKGDAYWLYVVEHATDPTKARVLRIQNPVAHARTFTFDRGWSEIARTDPPQLISDSAKSSNPRPQGQCVTI